MKIQTAAQSNMYTAYSELVDTYRQSEKDSFVSGVFLQSFAEFDCTMSTAEATQRASEQAEFAGRVWDDIRN